jgi:hypothetical protein
MKAAAKARCALQLLCASTCLAPGAAVAEPSFRIIGPSPQATTLFDVSLSDDGRVAGVSINTPAMSGGAWLNDLVADTTTLLASGRFATPPAVSADGAVAMTLLFNLGLGSSLVRYSDGTLTAIADAGNTVTSLSDDGQH